MHIFCDSGDQLTPGELIAEGILELLDETDVSDRHWRVSLFSYNYSNALPKQLPAIIKKPASLKANVMPIFSCFKIAGKSLQTASRWMPKIMI